MRAFKWLLIMYFLTPPLQADTREEFSDDESDSPYSWASFGVNGDSYDSRTYNMDASVALGEASALIAGFSTVRGTDEESEDGADYNTNSFYAGLSADFNETWKGSLYYDHWGQRSSLISRGVIGRLTYGPGDWNVSCNGGFHMIHYRTAEATDNSPAPHIGGHIGYDGWFPFGFHAGYTKYFYQDELAALGEDFENSLVPASVLSLSSGFVSEQSLAGISYAFSSVLLTLEGSRSTSVIDPVRISSLTLRTSFELSASWGLDVEAGRSRTEYEEPEESSYWGLTASYYW